MSRNVSNCYSPQAVYGSSVPTPIENEIKINLIPTNNFPQPKKGCNSSSESASGSSSLSPQGRGELEKAERVGHVPPEKLTAELNKVAQEQQDIHNNRVP